MKQPAAVKRRQAVQAWRTTTAQTSVSHDTAVSRETAANKKRRLRYVGGRQLNLGTLKPRTQRRCEGRKAHGGITKSRSFT
ncbi:hypothetical protein [Microbacterium sp. ProA8]|uniref:hypothetical protein n=1 Tax=Microbacterium chionoecetis TaxID=3153754 RepID=UPI003266B513